MNQPIVQTFKRYEKKYRLTTAQRAEFIRRVQPFMRPDDYGPAHPRLAGKTGL